MGALGIDPCPRRPHAYWSSIRYTATQSIRSCNHGSHCIPAAAVQGRQSHLSHSSRVPSEQPTWTGSGNGAIVSLRSCPSQPSTILQQWVCQHRFCTLKASRRETGATYPLSCPTARWIDFTRSICAGGFPGHSRVWEILARRLPLSAPRIAGARRRSNSSLCFLHAREGSGIQSRCRPLYADPPWPIITGTQPEHYTDR